MERELELRAEYERGVQAAREEWARNAFQRGYEDEMRRLRGRGLGPTYYEPLLWKCEGDK